MASFNWRYPEQGDHRQYMSSNPASSSSSSSKFSTFDQIRMDLASSNMDAADAHSDYLSSVTPQSAMRVIPSIKEQMNMPSTSKGNLEIVKNPEFTGVNTPISKQWDQVERMADTNATSITSGSSSGASPTMGALDVGKLVQEGARNGVNALGAMTNQQIEKDYASNSLQAGIHAGTQASIIKDQAGARNNTEQAFGMAGAMFGPVGAALGTLVGNKLGNIGAELPYMKTANSGGGKVNPQDTGVASTLNTYGQTGQTQQQDNSQ